jgi:hypothetical protein
MQVRRIAGPNKEPLTSIKDVHKRNRENIGLLGTSKVRNVSIERNTLGIS